MNTENLEEELGKRRIKFGKELKKIPKKRVRKVQEELNEIGHAGNGIVVGTDKRTVSKNYDDEEYGAVRAKNPISAETTTYFETDILKRGERWNWPYVGIGPATTTDLIGQDNIFEYSQIICYSIEDGMFVMEGEAAYG